MLRASGRRTLRAGRLLVQGHCHHKSVLKMTAEMDLLHRTGAAVELLDSGCCGMAGPFGFEREKFAVSQALGERVLLPAVRGRGAGDDPGGGWLQLPRTDCPEHDAARRPSRGNS